MRELVQFWEKRDIVHRIIVSVGFAKM